MEHNTVSTFDIAMKVLIFLFFASAIVLIVSLAVNPVKKNTSNLSAQLDNAALVAFTAYDQKEVTGEEVINAIDNFPNLAITVSNKIGISNYTLHSYNSHIWFTNKTITDLKQRELTVDADPRLIGVITEIAPDNDTGNNSDTDSSYTLVDLSNNSNLSKKAEMEYIPRYAKYYARLIVTDKEIQGISFKEVIN